MMKRPCSVGAVIGLAICLVGCSSDPEARKQRYLESGERFMAEQKFGEAVVEFRNAVQEDPEFGVAHERLSTALLEIGDTGNAARALVRAADLLPNDSALQLRAGSLLLVAGRFDDAASRAEKIVALIPTSVEAQVLKANALAGLRDFEQALAEIEAALATDPDRALTYTALGAVEAGRGRQAEAEAAFRRAVSLDSESVQALLALGNFQWTNGRADEAERAFTAAVAIDPRSPLANRALATLYLASGRAGEAEQFLAVLAREGRDGSSRLALADYYVMLRRYDAALEVLQPLLEERMRNTDARLRVAAIHYLKGQKAEAYLAIDSMLKKNPDSPQVLIAQARLFLVDQRIDEALAVLTQAILTDPNAAEAHYLNGLIALRRKQLVDALSSFKRVLELSPRSVPALVQLARIELALGNAPASLHHAQNALAHQSQNATARLVLAKGFLSEGNVEGAERELRLLLGEYPRWAAVHAHLGLVFLRRQDTTRATSAFETALKLDPNALEPVSGLFALDVKAGRYDAARTRLETRLAASPEDPVVLLLAARGFAVLKDYRSAEQLLTEVIEREPSNLDGYSDLAQLYVVQGRLDEALASFEQVAARKPGSVPIETMLGVLLQTRSRPDEAVVRYKRALAADRTAAVAANNLAWLYAEQGSNLETALELAKTAKQSLPDRPEVSDTLGYVYLKLNTTDLAVSALKEAVSQQPTNPRFRLRLGIALARAGNPLEARREIAIGLRGSSSTPESIEARAVLEQLP